MPTLFESMPRARKRRGSLHHHALFHLLGDLHALGRRLAHHAGGLAAELVAGAARHVLPLGRIVVLLRRAGAGMGAGGAIVGARLDDAEAMLERTLVFGRLGRAEAGHGDDRRERGRGDETLVHLGLLGERKTVGHRRGHSTAAPCQRVTSVCRTLRRLPYKVAMEWLVAQFVNSNKAPEQGAGWHRHEAQSEL